MEVTTDSITFTRDELFDILRQMDISGSTTYCLPIIMREPLLGVDFASQYPSYLAGYNPEFIDKFKETDDTIKNWKKEIEE